MALLEVTKKDAMFTSNIALVESYLNSFEGISIERITTNTITLKVRKTITKAQVDEIINLMMDKIRKDHANI